MWLYLPSTPSNSAPASACSAKASEPDSSFSASTTEPFATWSGKPLLPRNLPRLWKREPSIRRLSGLTCSPSTAQRGADAWISSLRVSRARTYRLPAAAPAWAANAQACSSVSSTLPTIAVRTNSFWRTSQASLLPPPPLWTKPKGLSKSARSPESWENWPTAGGMRSGSLFPRPTWAPTTGGSAGSATPGAWPTPDTGHERINRSASAGAAERPTIALAAKLWSTPDTARRGTEPPEQVRARRSAAGSGGLPLQTEAAYWSTPKASDGEKGGPNMRGSKGDLPLPSQSAQWMTPSVSNSQGNEYTRDRGQAGEERLTLTGQAQHWPTPASRDFRTPNSQESQESRNHSGGEQLPNFVEHHFSPLGLQIPSGQISSVPVVSVHGSELSPTTKPAHVLGRLRLNPAFGCWLMGWPSWWTNPGLTSCARSATASYRSALQLRLSWFFSAQG